MFIIFNIAVFCQQGFLSFCVLTPDNLLPASKKKNLLETGHAAILPTRPRTNVHATLYLWPWITKSARR